MKKCFVYLFFSCFFWNLSAQITLSGRVIDKETTQALKDCILYVDGELKPYFSTENGVISIPLEVGSRSVKIVKQGYDNLVLNIDINKDQYMVFELYPLGTSPEDKSIYKSLFTDEVIVQAIRANASTPGAAVILNDEDLAQENLGQDLPYLLEQETSVVVTSDAGNGIGYTSMRIRGTDMSRINFTINGIPYNDPESQAVYLVDVPDLASSLSDLQIQRGVGTSTNGAAAFGASVNMNTNKKNAKPYLEFNNAFGSFASIKNTLKLGTGLINNHFTFDARASHLRSNGYIDRANTKLWSYYLSGAYYGDKTIIRLNHFSGKETTYQAWNGVDAATLESNRTYNISGTDYGYKEQPYENEVDNYKQDHYQLFVSQQIKDNWNANIGLFYTRGKGYYEQYKVESSLSNYNLNDVILGGDTISSSDLIRRRWLDNHFYGATYSLNYKKINKLDLSFGGSWNQYDGLHYGEIIWAQFASNSAINQRYYENNGQKTDFNLFAKAELYASEKFLVFADLQYRRVSYNVSGVDNDQLYIFHDVDYNFVNPKFGLSYLVNNKSKLYTSFSIANKEPARTDFVDNVVEPKQETLYDLELGYNYQSKVWKLQANYYYMHYFNQLVLDGRLNDVGSALRTNVGSSFRTGVELSANLNILKLASLSANATWSVNEIKSFQDENGQIHDKTKIAYSPQWIGAAQLKVYPIRDFTFALINKFVGQQFLDNTSNTALSLDRYTQTDIRLSYLKHTKILKDIEFSLLLNNIANKKIVSNGYVYAGEAYYFPQARFNFMFGVNLKF
ncbi:MAG: TonB-dependent receptor [Chitinophagales bacterium]|nr:TonB-dependent receptor [Chitinophagales bacterium]